MRLIDGDKLVNKIVFHMNIPSEYKEQIEDAIQDMPIIVRCEDCSFYEKTISSYGERKDNV